MAVTYNKVTILLLLTEERKKNLEPEQYHYFQSDGHGKLMVINLFIAYTYKIYFWTERKNAIG